MSAAGRQTAPAERMGRREHRPDHDHGAGGEQRDGHQVADAAEQEEEAVRQRLPHLAAGPAEVEDEREEGREGDQAEPDQVPVALLELRQLEARQEPARTAALAAACGHPEGISTVAASTLLSGRREPRVYPGDHGVETQLELLLAPERRRQRRARARHGRVLVGRQ